MNQDSQLFKELECQLNCVNTSDLVLNCTVNPNPRLFDCIESWHCWDIIKGCVCMAMSIKFRQPFYIFGVTEKCPNNKVRGHYHFQVSFGFHCDTYSSEIIRDFINKLHGLFAKKIGNTKITKNLTLEKLNLEKARRGIPIDEEPEWLSFTHYMFKEVKHCSELYKCDVA